MNGHRHPRRFVRDGEVPVTVIHHEHDANGGVNRLQQSQQALEEQIVARERLEHQLQEAQATIRDLQTKLAHERISREEAARHADTGRQEADAQLATLREALDTEKAALADVERDRVRALRRAQKLEDRAVTPASMRTATATPDTEAPRRRGRAPKVARPEASAAGESEVVEWWVPGWQGKYRAAGGGRKRAEPEE